MSTGRSRQAFTLALVSRPALILAVFRSVVFLALVALCLLLNSCPGRAQASLSQEVPVRLQLNVYPPDARFWVQKSSNARPPDDLSSWFRAGVPADVLVRVELEPGEQPAEAARNAQITVLIERPGYASDKPVLQLGELTPDGDGVYQWPPDGGVHTMTATSRMAQLGVWARFQTGQAAATGAAALVVTGALVGLLQQRNHARALVARREALLAGADRSDPLVDTSIGPYLIVNKLGSGGMASVYRAVPSASMDEQEAVAVKVMQKDLADNDEFSKRFEREYRLAAGLDHPAIVKVIDFGEQDRLLYIVMEMVRGRTLHQVLGGRALEPDPAAAWMGQILEAVGFAHRKGVVHRDLKPENVMVLETGRLKVMDFGLARTHDSTKVTRTGTAMGTPAYMSPEQILTGVLDARSDQYSLGIMLYEMLTGRRPFESTEPMHLAMQQIKDQPPSLRDLQPRIPAGVERVVLRMLAKDSARRYPDLAAVGEALEKALAGDPRAEDEVPGAGSTGVSRSEPGGAETRGMPRSTAPVPQGEVAGEDTTGFIAPTHGAASDAPTTTAARGPASDETTGFQAPPTPPRA